LVCSAVIWVSAVAHVTVRRRCLTRSRVEIESRTEQERWLSHRSISFAMWPTSLTVRVVNINWPGAVVDAEPAELEPAVGVDDPPAPPPVPPLAPAPPSPLPALLSPLPGLAGTVPRTRRRRNPRAHIRRLRSRRLRSGDADRVAWDSGCRDRSG